MILAPFFQLNKLRSPGTYNLRDDFGKVIVITFWVSWCPDCGKDLPKKEQLYKTMDSEKVKMLTVNVTGREREAQQGVEFAKKFLTQPTLKDHGRQVYDLYESQGVPTTVVINQEGYIHSQFGDQASFFDIVKSIGTLI